MFKRMYPLYNAEGAMGGGEGASGDVSATSNSGEGFTSGWGLPKGQEQVSQPTGNQAAANANPLLGQPQQQVAAAPQPQVFDFAGRKIEVTDPAMLNVLKDVHKDYSSLQSTYTQTTNQVKELQNEKQTYMQLLQQQTQAPAQQAQQQPAPVDLEQVKADFMEQFYDDPKGAIEGLLDGMFQQKVQPVIEPMQKEKAWNDEVQGLQSKYEDFGSMIGPMQQLLQDMPQLAQHGLESVYQLAKRSAPAPQAPQPTPEQLLSDPAFREQALAHPELYQQAVSRYVNERQQTNSQIPVVMGNQPGGQIPSAPETRPTDIRGGSKAWLRSLGLGG